jgi:hypothetical protein
VRFPEGRDAGPARGPAPTVEIRVLSIVDLSQPWEQLAAPQIMSRRHLVIAGAGEVGIDFYPADSLTPQRISVIAAAPDDPTVTAGLLLAELTANLPAGYSAQLDPANAAAVLLEGSSSEPVFASLAVDAALLSVADYVSRYPVIAGQHLRMVWRVTFRSAGVSGSGIGARLMQNCKTHRGILNRSMLALGWSSGGFPASIPFLPTDRRESTAALDIAILGASLGAQTRTPMRASQTTANAAN